MPENTLNRQILDVDEKTWDLHKKRFELIYPLSQQDTIGHSDADQVALILGLSRRHVYTLANKIRTGSGLLTDILPKLRSGGKGKGRISEKLENIIDSQIKKHYLKKQKINIATLYKYIKEECYRQEIKPPVRNTLTSRVNIITKLERSQKRHGKDVAHSFKPTQVIDHSSKDILDQVQIDHTVVDLIIVDQSEREPIGRPYITVAIDTHSRCILGAIITLDAPSSTSVGLCVSQILCNKSPWLNMLGVDVEWNVGGKPLEIYVDNASEFKSEALERGCDIHGIKLNYRPPGRPHYGGIVERVIGTLMSKVHSLPGTTFSNMSQKGKYNSDKESALTLNELEKWLVLSIYEYHHSLHDTLKTTPMAAWEMCVGKIGKPNILTDEASCLIDFLPIMRRKLTRSGFVIDHVHYFCNTLKPLLANKDKNGMKFIIRRDPRDISRIWVLDPEFNEYIEVSYNLMSNPSVSMWEHRQAIKKLRENGIEQIDEGLIFRTINEMQKISDNAVKTTKKSRRLKERKKSLEVGPVDPSQIEPPKNSDDSLAEPFDQIEDW